MTVYNLNLEDNLEDFVVYAGVDGVPGGWIAYSLLNPVTADTADEEFARQVMETIASGEGRPATDEDLEFIDDIKAFFLDGGTKNDE